MSKKTIVRIIGVVFILSWVSVISPPGLSAGEFDGETDITISAVGDCLISNKVSFLKNPSFLKLLDIFNSTHCTYGNCETTFFNPEDGFPAYKDLDPNVYCEPWGADELKWMGFDLMSLANNHIMDFDYDGMFATLKHLDRVGIKYAGAGKDLEFASRHGLYETEAGPVSLISCASWLPEPNHKASLPGPYMKGRPGHNAINVDWVVTAKKEQLDKLREIRNQMAEDFGDPMPEEALKKEIKEKKLRFGDMHFAEGEKTEFTLVPNKDDVERVIASIKIAKRNSRLVIATIHEHIGRDKNKLPSVFQEDFAHKCIDAGADMFMGTGSHELWGIEIYKNRPIFYGLGNFFFQGPLRVIAPEAYVRFDLPADTKDPTLYELKFADYFKGNVFWESVVPKVTFDKDNKVKEIILYPIHLNQKAPLNKRGTPELADKKTAKTIIERLNKLSETWKTKIIFKDGIGTVVL